MVKYKNKLSAAAVFLVMCFTLVMSGYDSMTSVGATGGTDYVKYTYATGTQVTYNLPEIPTMASANALTMRAASYSDPRDPYYDSAVVRLNLYDYVNPNNPSSGSYVSFGTGFIIGDHEIMTAAHCVYDKNDGFNDYVKISFPDNDGSVANSSKINVVSAHVPQDYINLINNPTGQGSQDLDYAILTVDEDLSQYGYYLLGMGTDSIKQKNVPIHSLGYYGDTLKISHGTVNGIGELSYNFDLYSYYGSSGGPIYTESVFGIQGSLDEEYQIKTYRTAISIVHGPSGTVLVGTRIRPIIIQFAYDNAYL